MYLDLVHSFPPGKLLQFPFDLYLMDTLHEEGAGQICMIYYVRCTDWMSLDGVFVFWYTVHPHLHLQHLVENGLSQTFSDVSLLGSLDQLVSVLLVWNNPPTPGDLMA